MTLSAEDKERVRYHLGYLGTTDAASIASGIPASRQTLFILENALGRLMAVSEPRVLRILDVLDGIECRMVEGLDYLAADKLGELSVRKEQIAQLEEEYDRWSGRLADIFAVPKYPYAQRNQRGKRVGSIPVRQ